MIERLRDLYGSENKPADLTPSDVALLTYLLLKESEDHFVYDSQETIAARLGCERGAVARSIDRLEKLGWVTVRKQWDWTPETRRKTRGIFGSSGLSLNLDKLPTRTDRAKRNAPGDEAKRLAAEYTGKVVANGGTSYKRFPKRWKAHQEWSAQWLIDKAGSPEMAWALVSFALDHAAHQKAVLRTLYELRRRFTRVWADYEREIGYGSAHKLTRTV